MKRLWSRVGLRATSVGLLVLGVVGGVYLGQDRALPHGSAQAQLVMQSDAEDMQLLKQRESEHAAARAWRNQAEGDAAAKAATAAKAAAQRARTLEKRVIATKDAQAKAKAAGVASATSTPFVGPIPASCQEFSGNRGIGCTLMLQAGFAIDQFPCMDRLFKRESGWNQRASNAGSGAYGIPQALPGDKMAKFGSDWRTNPVPQIKWGLDYIKNRYSTPCGAWAHSQSTGWY